MYKVCIDTGGTFADCMVLDDRGYKKEYKAPSTPKDFSVGVLDSLREAAAGLSMTDREFLDKTESIIHGTIAATTYILKKED